MLHSVFSSTACWPLTSDIPAAQTGFYASDLRHCAACGMAFRRMLRLFVQPELERLPQTGLLPGVPAGCTDSASLL